MSKYNRDNLLFIDGVPFNIEKTARANFLLGKGCYKNIDEPILELGEYIMLSYVISNPELSQSDIAKLLYKGKAHVGKILNEMETKGYIKRVAVSDNNMLKKLTKITPKGQDIYDKTHKEFSKIIDKVLGNFSDEEIEIFGKLLNKYRSNIVENFDLDF